MECTLSTKGIAEVTAQSNLTIKELLQIGFDVGLKVEASLDAKVTVTPGYKAMIQPRATMRTERFWEVRDVYYRTCTLGFCGDWQKHGTELASGQGSKPRALLYRATEVRILY